MENFLRVSTFDNNYNVIKNRGLQMVKC
jgi:hypothetical protein